MSPEAQRQSRVRECPRLFSSLSRANPMKAILYREASEKTVALRNKLLGKRFEVDLS